MKIKAEHVLLIGILAAAGYIGYKLYSGASAITGAAGGIIEPFIPPLVPQYIPTPAGVPDIPIVDIPTPTMDIIIPTVPEPPVSIPEVPGYDLTNALVQGVQAITGAIPFTAPISPIVEAVTDLTMGLFATAPGAVPTPTPVEQFIPAYMVQDPAAVGVGRGR